MRTRKLDELRPIFAFEDDYMIARTSSYAAGFELTMKGVFTMTDEDYTSLCAKFTQIFSSLPSYSIVHKMDVFTEDKFIPKQLDNEDILYQAYKTKFNERLKLKHKSYLFICKGNKSVRSNSTSNSSVFKSGLVPKEFKDKKELEEFQNAVNRVEILLNDDGQFKVSRFSENDFRKLTSQYENLSFLDSAPKYSSDLFQDSTSTKIGQNYLTAVSLNSLECLPVEFEDYFKHPKYKSEKSNLFFSLFYPLGIDFAGDHLVNQIWIVDDKDDVIADLKSNDNYNTLFKRADAGNSLTIEDNNAFSTSLEEGLQPVRYHANIILWDRDRKALSVKENLAMSAFNKINISPNVSFEEVLTLYWACYPGNAYEIGFKDQTFPLLGRQAAALNVYETTNEDDISEFGVYMSDRVTGCPVYVDISDLPMKKGITNNRNKLILGPSGSGKSVFTNNMINNYIRFDTDVVVVDVGDSYERLCKLNNGVYLKYEENSPISFNPFSMRKEELTVEKKQTLVTLIFTLWGRGDDYNSDEYAIVSKSLHMFFDRENLIYEELSFNNYYEYLRDDFIPYLKDTAGKDEINTNSLLNVLDMFYDKGEYGYLLNSFDNTGFLEDPFIVFELDNIKDHPILFPIITLVIMDTFIAKMRLRKGRRKVIIIEEAWKAISKAGMAEFLKYLYKTVRKHFGEAILVTQEPKDIIGSPIIKDAIIKNCGVQILLDMRKYANQFDEIQDMLSLNKTAKELVLSLNLNNFENEFYKEVFIGMGNQGAVYGINISYVELATYTTEKKHKEIIDGYYDQYKSWSMAILLFAEDLERQYGKPKLSA